MPCATILNQLPRELMGSRIGPDRRFVAALCVCPLLDASSITFADLAQILRHG